MSEKKKVGFAVIDPARHREICSKGGKAVHAKGTGHKFTTGSDLAKTAGAKGGRVCHENRSKREDDAANKAHELSVDRSNTSAVAVEDDLGAAS